MFFFLFFLFSIFSFAQPHEPIEDRLSKTVSTIDTHTILNQLFEQNPELLERAQVIESHTTALGEAESLRSDSETLFTFFDPFTGLLRKLPFVGDSLALAMDVIVKGIGGGGYVLGKIDESTVRKSFAQFPLLSNDEILLRGLLEQYLTEICVAEKALHKLTVGRESYFYPKDFKETTFVSKVKGFSLLKLKNSFQDFTDQYFITRFHEKRAKEVNKLSEKLKLGKMRFEYFVREIEIKAVERILIKKQQQRSWFGVDEKFNAVEKLKKEGLTEENLSAEIGKLKDEALLLIALNAQLSKEILNAHLIFSTLD